MIEVLILSSMLCGNLPGWACDAQLLTGINPKLLYSICHVESKGRVTAYTPHDGDGTPSYGVCQLKLRTARHMGFTGVPEDLIKPSINALYAAKYILWQHRRYKDVSKAISAYNVGHAAENTSYVAKVLKVYSKLEMN